MSMLADITAKLPDKQNDSLSVSKTHVTIVSVLCNSRDEGFRSDLPEIIYFIVPFSFLSISHFRKIKRK